MKGRTIYKTVQFVILVLIMIASAIYVMTTPDVFHIIATEKTAGVGYGLLWLTLMASFIFMLIDVVFVKKNRKKMKNLEYKLYNDAKSGIFNRYSLDNKIEDLRKVGVGDDFGCAVIEFTNIREINQKFGRTAGDIVMVDFAKILNAASEGLCVVGHNGGNSYLALFENGAEKNVEIYLERIKSKVNEYNISSSTSNIVLNVGTALNSQEKKEDPRDLIALAYSRV